MGKVFDFEKARMEKFAPPSYVAPEQIEIPEFVQEAVADQRARQQRELLRAAVKLIDSDDIPAGNESGTDEPLPVFNDPSTDKE